MGLIKCKDCGKEVSDASKVCINCGSDIQKQIKNKKKRMKKLEEI